MSLFDALRHRIWSALRSTRADRDRVEEYDFHQSLAQEQQTHDGASPTDARFAARREFGNRSDPGTIDALHNTATAGQRARFTD